MLPRPVVLLLWRVLAVTSVLLGFVGVFVPVLPTVPFLLLAAWAGGHGWPALEAWLLNHPRHGPAIRRWRERGAVPRKAKWGASLMLLASGTLLLWAPVPWPLKVGGPLFMAAVAWWLWRRPEA
jgi:uncharacterized membrane protein YbaN (DUF454 family)